MANSVAPDQTAPESIFWSGFALFSQTYLSVKSYVFDKMQQSGKSDFLYFKM